MKRIILVLVFCFGIKVCLAQILIQASGPIDVCYPSSVTLEVVFPQVGYTYNWFIGGYGCPVVDPAAPYTYFWNNGTTSEDLTAVPGGTYYCICIDNKGCAELISVTLLN